MKPFSFIIALIALAVGSLVAAPAQPNIVVFISDDHSQLDSQAYGSSEVRTPTMAKLAAEGLKFTHDFVASPSCGPSRTALLTGLWPARNGSEPNHKPENPGVASLSPFGEPVLLGEPVTLIESGSKAGKGKPEMVKCP